MSLYELQRRVHVGKDKTNDFGGYNYRTAEGILAAIKSAMPEGATIIVTDDLREVAGQIFVQSTACVTFADGSSQSAMGFAMHPLTKKGMDPSQITGSASSYARKVALGGLMALDDGSGDPDSAKDAYQPEPTPQFDSAGAAQRIINSIGKKENVDELKAFWNDEKPTTEKLTDADFDRTKTAFLNRGKSLSQPQADAA